MALRSILHVMVGVGVAAAYALVIAVALYFRFRQKRHPISWTSESPAPPERCPLNVPGDFYTCGTCLACGLPEGEAPELLAPLTDTNSITYFIKQPQTPEEVEHACRAIQVCCVADLRYGGSDLAILKRLRKDANDCDFMLREGA